MANDKILAFRVNITGTSEEAQGIAKIDTAMQKLSKTRSKLLKKQRDGIGLTKNEKTALAKTGSSIEDLKNKKQQLVKVERQASREFNAQSGSMAQLRARTSKLRAEMEKLNLKTAEGRRKQKEMGREVLNNTKKIRDYDRRMSGSSTLVGEYSKGMVNAFKKIAGGIFVAVTAIRTFTRILSQATSQFREFEKGQTNVQTLLDRTNATLEGKSIELIKNYGLQIGDVNKSLFDAVSAGVDAGKSVEFLDTATRLAIGGVTDLNIAVDGITTVMNAYGKTTEEAEQIASAFFSAQKFGKTTVGELASEIGNVAPVAAQLDISYQELLTTYASLTKQGIKTQQSTTAIKSIMTALIKPSTEAQKAFKQLGIETGAAAIKQNGLYKTLVQVSEAAEKDADVLAELIPNVRALTGVGALGTRQLKEYDKILKTVNEDYGEGSSLAKAYGMQAKTLDQTMDRIGAAFTARRIELGRFFQPLIEGFADIVAPVENATEKLQKQKVEMNLLIRSITAATTSEESRERQLISLNDKYPDFLKNLDQEKVTNEELVERMTEVNEQYDKRIKLSIVEQLYKKQSDAIADLIIQEDNLNQALAYQKGIVDGTEIVPISPAQTAILNAAPGNVRRLTNELEDNKIAQEELNTAAERQIALINEMKIASGIDDDKETPEPDGKTPRVLKALDIDETGLETADALMKEAVAIIDSAYDEIAADADDKDKLYWKRLKLKINRELAAEAEAERKKQQLAHDTLQLKLQTMDAIARSAEAVSELFLMNQENELRAAEGNEEKQEQIRKKYYKREQLASSLTAAINTAVAITKVMGQTGVLSPLVIPAIVAQGLAAQIAIWAKKYETGGMVESGNEMPGAPKSGDNTLAMVKPGEVILNQNQQQALGGYDVFKRIGVPGFAAGGVVEAPIAPTQSGGSYDQQFTLLAERIIDGFNNKNVVLRLNELEEAQNERTIVTQSQGL